MENDRPQRQLAISIVDKASESERMAIKSWITELLSIREAPIASVSKGSRAVKATLRLRILWPIIKILASELKRRAWIERSKSARIGIGASAVGIAIFGGQGAGIAALGTAIGVPLWIVLGAGSAFAHMLYEEIARKSPKDTARSEPFVDAIKGKDGIHRL